MNLSSIIMECMEENNHLSFITEEKGIRITVTANDNLINCTHLLSNSKINHTKDLEKLLCEQIHNLHIQVEEEKEASRPKAVLPDE